MPKGVRLPISVSATPGLMASFRSLGNNQLNSRSTDITRVEQWHVISCSLFDADESEETPTEEPLKIESGYAFSVLDDADATWKRVIRRIKAELRRQGFTGNMSTIKGDPVRKKQRQPIAGMPTLLPVASLSNPDLIRVDNGILTPARTTLNRSQENVADRAGLR